MINKKEYTLLLVDDDRAFRELVRYELEEEGYLNILEAENGEEALDIVAKKHIDLILLDLRMPMLEGEDVLRVVKENYPKISVIVLSGQTAVEVKKNVLKLGADLFLEKPYNSADLFNSINKVLNAK